MPNRASRMSSRVAAWLMNGESAASPSNVKSASWPSKSMARPRGGRVWPSSMMETIRRMAGTWFPYSRSSWSAGTVSNTLVSRLITSTFRGVYRSISSVVVLTRSPGWPGASRTG